MANSVLKVGDRVMWRGAFGFGPAKPAVVVDMQRVAPGDKYGDNVDEMPWDEVRRGYCVVSLDNGHWAYGTQLDNQHMVPE